MDRLLFTPEEEEDEQRVYSILVADDDAMICRMFDALLKKVGYDVMTAENTTAALTLLEREIPDLVITDIFLGGDGGLEILRKAKERDEDIPVILITGSPDRQCIIDALRDNADDILIKPVGKDELYFRVSKAVEQLRLKRKEKRMKEMLQERQTLFSTFMDHLPLQIFINDDQDRLIYANRKHDEFYNSRDNLMKKLEDLFPPEVVDDLYRKNEEARKKGLLDYFQVMKTTDGRKRKFRTLLFPLDLGGRRRNLLAGIGIDMTDENLVREALKESEDRLAAFIRTIPHGLMENDTKGIITLCNPGYCRLLGLEPEDVLGRNLSEFQPTEEERKRRLELIRRLKDGSAPPEPFMGRVRRSDGKILHVQVDWDYRRDEDGRVIGYIAAVTDVTRLLRAEEQIRRSEALLKSIMESPRNINIWSVDRDIRYTFFNYNHKRAMKAYWNADIELGQYLLDYITDQEYIDEARDYYRQVLSGEHMDIIDRIPDQTGKVHVFENYSNPIFDEDGNVTGATIFTIDVTGRVEDEEKIKQSLKEKEVLLREIHHRVKNNLQVISSILNMQADGIEEDGVRKNFLDSQNRIRSMSLIHEQLYQNESLAAIRMDAYVQSLISSIADSMVSIDEVIDIKTDLDPVDLDIDTAIPVGLILNELVSNSIKYGRRKGQKNGILITLEAEGDICRIVVRDRGPGMPEGAPKAGSSLGLQLVFALSDQLGGNFKMENDNGLTCTLTFPRSPRV